MRKCPLRKMIKSADFEVCYEEKCEWWIITNRIDDSGHCAITVIADILELIKLNLEPLVVSQ